MQELFLETLQLSLTGSLFALAVMLVRGIFRKAPKWLFCLLWGIVALRLICPLSIESALSMVPDNLASGQVIESAGKDYIGEVDIIYEGSTEYAAAVESGRQPIYSDNGYYVVTEKDSYDAPPTVEETVYPILTRIWLAGMVLMIAYTAVSYALLMRKMAEATRLRDNIWQCEQADSPFVLGFFLPKIYLPYQLSGPDMAHVIAHEQAHIRRRDHWWKPIGFLLLSIHWFNPVMWVAYILLCRDIEAACDEKVIRHMEKDEIRAYSTALLHCSVHRRRIAACPLAFGEVGVKERIKRIMNYKKPAFWIILLAVIASLVAGVLLLTNPAADPDTETTVPTEDATEDTANDPTKPPVDAALLADLTAKFSEWGSPYNMALCSDYDTPAKLDLMDFFYQGFADESTKPTDGEWAQLKDLPFFDINMSLHRLPTAKMNAVLQEYFGITLEEMDDSAFEGLAYLEDTDCYYFMTTGARGTEAFKVTASEALEDGTIRIYYTAAFAEEHIVTLRPTAGGYLIVSNLASALGTDTPAPTDEATSPTTPSETVPDNQMTAEELAPFKAMLEEKTSYPNMALTTLYTSPQEMDLWWFFTKGTNDKPNLTDAEVAFLTAEGYHFDWNIQKQSKADLDAVLMEYFGITIDESYGNGLEKFTYWAETDCFYDNYNGVEYSYATVQRGVWNSDGTVSIYYTDDWGDWEYEVRLMPKEDGGCRFLSNLPYRKLTAFSDAALDHPMTAEELAPFKAMLEEKVSYPNMALLSLYESGREVDLGWLFCNSTDDKADLTDAEAAFLEAKGFNFNMAIQRQSRAELDAVMLEYFGITLAESSGKSLKAFTYWEETDCCYSNYNGVNYADVQVHHGNWNESGTVSIYYTELTSGWEMEVRLQPTNDGGYVFVYNWLNLH